MEIIKFSLGEIWFDREDNPFLIIEVNQRNENYPIQAKHLIDDFLTSYTRLGYDVGTDIESSLDLVTYKGHKEDFPEYFL